MAKPWMSNAGRFIDILMSSFLILLVQVAIPAATVVAQDAVETCHIKVEDLTSEAFAPFGQVLNDCPHVHIYLRNLTKLEAHIRAAGVWSPGGWQGV